MKHFFSKFREIITLEWALYILTGRHTDIIVKHMFICENNPPNVGG